MFPNNVHTIERGARVVIGLGMLGLLAVGPVPGWGLVGLVGIVPLATGAIGSCPLYTLFGLSTAGHDGDHAGA
ncbi:MAG: DUF2892 domain-containing protein [Deltaproteobacteria bacterium]|nr:MAG: DUF2892 domain-containing protein [Deltaproteobacteria bacterium]